MAHTLRLKHTYRQAQSGVLATIRTVAQAIVAEQTLALRAAEKAASSRRNAAEVRAMYVPTFDSQQESGAVANSNET